MACPLQPFPWAEFRVDGDTATFVDSHELPQAAIRLIAERMETPATVPFSGLIASFPLDDRSHLFAKVNQANTVQCHLVPIDQLPMVVAGLSDSTATQDVAPSIENLDQVEPLLRCVTANQRTLVYGCEPGKTIATVWQMIPPSCRHELTFAAPPFLQTDPSLYFSPEFDSNRLGPNRASVLLDLSSSYPFGDMDDDSLSWSIAVHSQLNSDNPQESLEKFFGSHCSSASLGDLATISLEWCEQQDASAASPQLTMAKTTTSPQHGISDPSTAPRHESSLACSVDSALGTDQTLPHDAVIEQLGQLDDAVFDAIAGAEDGLARMRALWPTAKDEIAPHLIDESREHYLRYVVNEWTQRFGDETDPAACLPTIEVMRILLGDDQ